MYILVTVLGIFGSVASVAGLLFAYVTWVNPMRRFRWFMKKSNRWQKKFLYKDTDEQYVYKPNPSYQIHSGDILVRGFYESWIPSMPDKDNNYTFKVFFVANGIRISSEIFVSLDGGRVIVPLPNGNENDGYFYNRDQLLVGKIVACLPEQKWADLSIFAKDTGILA